MAEKHRKKLYQVDYTVQSAKHLMGSQDKEVGQVASILGMYLGVVRKKSDLSLPKTTLSIALWALIECGRKIL
jgi:hypothetical protein